MNDTQTFKTIAEYPSIVIVITSVKCHCCYTISLCVIEKKVKAFPPVDCCYTEWLRLQV